ncbi:MULTISPECIES: DMT family transporter [Pseudomonas]|uniref:DMT family transporter n=1 Tax=Pseudomonas quercus TaxID=2722792 RepID=A0ABX0YHT2_9PSED|nr:MULTISPECIES: DMT family transporter [Pseudomonas]MBF7143937.1 DMT family transporter [Pseudomonas sp. LY10J]NJP02477.1 DMT family transporter [Pseudomonas quercus]
MTHSTSSLTGTSQPLKGMLLIVIATLLFASHDVLSKYLSGIYPVMLVIWVRYLVHTLLMMGIFLPQSGLRILRTRRPWHQVLRALCLLGTSLLFVSGLQYIPLAEATAVNFLAPLMVTALSVPLLGERVSAGQWAAVLVGFGGVMTIVHPGGELFTPAILFPFGSALCFCFYQILTRKVAEVDSPTTSNFFAGIFNTVLMSAVVPFFWHWPTWFDGLFMIALGACGMTAHLLLTQAFRYAPPALLAPLGYCQIVFAGIYGFLVFGHSPTTTTVIGIAVICGSGIAAAWVQRRARPASPPLAAAQPQPSGAGGNTQAPAAKTA